MNSLLLAASVLDPAELLKAGGFILLLVIVFAESGLLIGFFLPGDSLLFVAGMVAAGTLYEAFPKAGDAPFAVPPWVLHASLFLVACRGERCRYHFCRAGAPPQPRTLVVQRPNADMMRTAEHFS